MMVSKVVDKQKRIKQTKKRKICLKLDIQKTLDFEYKKSS